MSRPAVHVEGLSYAYAARSEPSLLDIAFSLTPGSWNVLVGGTGSGKSTLLRALAGIIPHHASGEMRGSVQLFGRDTRAATPGTLARTVGLVLQSPDDQICTTRVESEIAFGLENLALPTAEIQTRIDESLAAVGLEAFRDCETSELSGGQTQRLVLASVLALRPQLVLLDEPLSQLDTTSALELLAELDRLRARGVTIVIAEHRLHEVLPRADRVLLLAGGRLTYDGPTGTAEMSVAFAAADLEPPDHAADSLTTILAGPIQNSVTGDDRTASAGPAFVMWVRNLSYHYGSNPAPTLRNVSLDLRLGERVAVVGSNGSGKSTLFGLLAGLLSPTAGEIEHADHSRDCFPLGMVLQQADLMLFCRTVREELAFGPRQLRLPAATISERVQRVARQLDLEALLDEPPQALSQGQRLRVAVAATIMLAPRVLVLDEPTTGLDPRQIERLMQEIAPSRALPDEAQRALIFSTHDLRTVARYADRVVVLDRGEVAIDAPTRDALKFLAS